MGGKSGSGRRRRRNLLTAEDWEETKRHYVAEMIALGAEAAEAEADAARKVELARRRLEWGRERLAAFFAMQDRAGEAYDKQIDEHPDVDWESEDAPQLPDPPEEAIAQAIYAEVMAAIREDRWPRHLHDRNV
jgi:cytosine/adenosine deaminase-related metal-dependent hydrolase